MGKSLKPNLTKLKTQIAQMQDIAKKENWQYLYDQELDTFYFSPNRVDKEARLFAINDEYSLYLDENSNLKGIFIEYFKSNFLKHEKGFEEFNQVFTKRVKGFLTFPNNEKSKSKGLLLTDALKGQILTQLISQRNTSIYSSE